MRKLALALILLCLPAQAETIGPEWTKVTEIYVNTGVTRQWKGPVFVNSYNGQGPEAGVWYTVDLTLPPWNVPADAKVAFLSGHLIITHGTTPEIADLGLNIRAPGDNRVSCELSDLTGQAVSGVVGEGIRDHMSTWVPLINGEVEYCWSRSTPPNWPDHASYGVNLGVHAWAR